MTETEMIKMNQVHSSATFKGQDHDDIVDRDQVQDLANGNARNHFQTSEFGFDKQDGVGRADAVADWNCFMGPAQQESSLGDSQ